MSSKGLKNYLIALFGEVSTIVVYVVFYNIVRLTWHDMPLHAVPVFILQIVRCSLASSTRSLIGKCRTTLLKHHCRPNMIALLTSQIFDQIEGLVSYLPMTFCVACMEAFSCLSQL